RDESQVGNGIWKSGDAGATWSRVNTGLPNDVSAEVIVLDPHDAKRLLVGTMQGLYLSTNGGSSWTRLRSEEIWDVEADPTNPETVYAGGLEGIYQSHDFGATWTNVSADLPEGRVRSLAVNSTGEIVYAAVDGYGLYGAVSPSVGSIPLDEGTTATSENNYRGLMVEQLGHTTETSTDLATSFKDSPTTRRFLLIAGSATGGLLLLLVVVGVVAHRYRKKIAVDSPRD
ncbi:hypothetical protein HY523_02230, partial [Candidatus Berkelbacteria bacterium]|nr:hypothetical protein [Candidatus Berkelbacteria bacterium]